MADFDYKPSDHGEALNKFVRTETERWTRVSVARRELEKARVAAGLRSFRLPDLDSSQGHTVHRAGRTGD